MLEKATERLQRLGERTKSVRPMGPAPTMDSTETAMGNHSKEQQSHVESHERTSQNPFLKNMMATLQELVPPSSLGRDPVADSTLR